MSSPRLSLYFTSFDFIINWKNIIAHKRFWTWICRIRDRGLYGGSISQDRLL